MRIRMAANGGMGEDVIPLIRHAVEDFEPQVIPQTTGTVLTVEDGIATVSGLPSAFYGEICCLPTAFAAWCKTWIATKSAASFWRRRDCGRG